MQIFVEHWGIICNFTPIFPIVNIGGDEPRPRFFSGEQIKRRPKKGLHQKWNTFFPQIQVKTKEKKTVFTKNEILFSRFQVETCAQMHTRVKLLEGMQMKTILKLQGGYSEIIGGNIFLPIPRVSAPLIRQVTHQNFYT